MDLERADRRAFSRRAFLLGAVGATTASVLAACAQPSQPPAAATTAPAAPAPTKPVTNIENKANVRRNLLLLMKTPKNVVTGGGFKTRGGKGETRQARQQ